MVDWLENESDLDRRLSVEEKNDSVSEADEEDDDDDDVRAEAFRCRVWASLGVNIGSRPSSVESTSSSRSPGIASSKLWITRSPDFI